jgi:hypothetical protein
VQLFVRIPQFVEKAIESVKIIKILCIEAMEGVWYLQIKKLLKTYLSLLEYQENPQEFEGMASLQT